MAISADTAYFKGLLEDFSSMEYPSFMLDSKCIR